MSEDKLDKIEKLSREVLLLESVLVSMAAEIQMLRTINPLTNAPEYERRLQDAKADIQQEYDHAKEEMQSL